MSESIKQILMRRDGMSAQEALNLIEEAREALQAYLATGDYFYAEDICQEYFNLEPDYIHELM
jgi:hypothetical protein